MEPFRGKASGKTPRFLLEERIAELEAELRAECVHCGQPIPHVHKHESTRELALRLRAEKAEAELADVQKELVGSLAYASAAKLDCEKAEAELAKERAPRLAYMKRCAKAEAEVERLQAYRRLDSLYVDDLSYGPCVILPTDDFTGSFVTVLIKKEGGGRESVRNQERTPDGPKAAPYVSDSAAANPAARKERDEG